jgi:hypothetical protein
LGHSIGRLGALVFSFLCVCVCKLYPQLYPTLKEKNHDVFFTDGHSVTVTVTSPKILRRPPWGNHARMMS